MRCPRCREPAGPGDRFCPGCGAPLDSPAEDGRVVTIGREADNDIVLEDDRVSRHHARVIIRSTGMTIEDLGSANGIKVRGAKVSSIRIRLGDEVRFGSYPFDTYKLQPFLVAMPGPQQAPRQERRGMPWVLAASIGALILVAVVVALVTSGGGGGGDSATREYLVLTESWDGAQLTQQRVSAEIVSLSKGKFRFRFSGADLQLPSGPLQFSLGQGQPEVTTRTDRDKPIHKASLYHALARALVAHQPAGNSRLTIPIQVPQGNSTKSLGTLDLQLKSDLITVQGKQWIRVTASPNGADIISSIEGGRIPTRARGTFIWDSNKTTLAVADMLVEQAHGTGTAWTRFSVLLADTDATAHSLLKDLRGRVRAASTRRGSAVSKLAMAELGWITRSSALFSAVEAEDAHNPVFLALLGLAHIADTAYTFGANLGYDLAMRRRDPNHRINPFDGDEQSILVRYVYRNAASGWATLAAQMGLTSMDQVDGYAHWGGKVLHFAGDIAGGLSMKKVVHSVATGQGAHLAHKLWGMAAHASGAAQKALVALGRLAYYGSRMIGRGIKALELVEVAAHMHELWRTRPWQAGSQGGGSSAAGPSCANACPEAGRRECVAGGFRVCGDLNEDSCLEWGPTQSCGAGKKCVNGACVGSGPMRFTLTWNTDADIDLHLETPCDKTIWYKNKKACGGQLDVDDKCGSHQGAPGGPENIYWEDMSAPSGVYTLYVRYYAECRSGSGPTQYKVQIQHGATSTVRTGLLNPGVGRRADQVKVYQFRR